MRPCGGPPDLGERGTPLLPEEGPLPPVSILRNMSTYTSSQRPSGVTRLLGKGLIGVSAVTGPSRTSRKRPRRTLVCVCTSIYVRFYACMCVCMYVCMYVRKYVCMYVYESEKFQTNACVCLHVNMYTCVCMHACMHVYHTYLCRGWKITSSYVYVCVHV